MLFVLTSCSKEATISDQTYPWQINITPAGNSQVFDIELGKSPLGHAASSLKKRYELGLFQDRQGKLSLEAYFSEITRGGLSGKLIVILYADERQLEEFKINSHKGKRQESGVIKYLLTREDQKLSEQLIVSSLSYIPYVNLDKKMIENRFGRADQVIRTKDGLTHYIFEKKGLDIIYSEDGKEVLQYVSPSDFKTLLQPLENQIAQ